MSKTPLDELPELLTYAQAAKVLGVCTATIGRYARAGLLDAVGLRPWITLRSIKRLLTAGIGARRETAEG